ncbi:MAG: hypothetical protein M1831_002925 [Alyxoria varia]|nr:MAG: hypothetical protein M1831_002925 [Alyxoria varia]
MEARQRRSFFRRKGSGQDEQAQTLSSQDLPMLQELQTPSDDQKVGTNGQLSQRTHSGDNQSSSQRTRSDRMVTKVGQQSPETNSNTQQQCFRLGQTSVWYRGVRLSSNDMWTAILAKDYDQLRKCIKAGLDPNYCRIVQIKNTKCSIKSVLDRAIMSKNAEAVALLLDTGADISGSTTARIIEDTERRRGPTWQEIVSAEYPPFPELPHYGPKDWLPAVHLAAFTGDPEVLKMILQSPRCDPHALGSKGKTALHHCIPDQHEDAAKTLLNHGAKIDEPDNIGITPLKGAALAGSISLVRFFVEHGARIEVVDRDGETALHDAASRKRLTIVKYLLSYGSELEAKNNNGMTPFFIAASRFEKDVMNVLADYGADVDSVDGNGCTALIRAVMAGNEPLANYLLNFGVDIDISDHDGWTVFDVAMIKEDDQILLNLLSHSPNLSRADAAGNTLLHRAAGRGSSRLVRYLLTAQNQDPNVANHLSETPLHFAASNGRHNTTRLLLRRNANPNARDDSSCTPLARAVAFGSFAVVRELASNRAEFDQSTVSHYQPRFSQSAPAEQRTIIGRYMKANYPHISLSNQANLSQSGTNTLTTVFDHDAETARMVKKQGHQVVQTRDKVQTDPFVASIQPVLVPPQVINYIQNVQNIGDSPGAQVAGELAGSLVGNVAGAAISSVLG